MFVRLGLIGLATVVLAFALPVAAMAVAPETVQQGRVLFERTWSPGNPAIGSDGLGPLFNAESCVACHHQGGVGGGGDSRFNAMTLGIEAIHFAAPRTTSDQLAQFMRSFYPAFVQPDGTIQNTAILPHHGASPQLASLQANLLAAVPAQRSAEGGPVDVDEVRRCFDTPIQYSSEVGGKPITVKARLFQRNTTSLFGAGLIDTISDDAILQQAKVQQRHPEISGRPAVLRDGSLGRFGWRGNVSRLVQFVDRACANEMGLETKRRPQAADPTNPGYRNPATDIDDSQIEAMSLFVASLPAPSQQRPTDPVQAAEVARGQAAFASVGCAVCHVPQLDGVAGLYSDLLLHDMGPALYDYDAAEPEVIRQRVTLESRQVEGTEATVSYYGQSSVIRTTAIRSGSYLSPRRTTATEDYVTHGIGQSLGRMTTFMGRTTQTAEFRQELGIKRWLRPSNTSQEWRTPPLWGVKDSAPYLHDGRAETLLEAIAMHDGESAGTRDRFLNLSLADRQAVVAFLETLIAPPDAPQRAL